PTYTARTHANQTLSKWRRVKSISDLDSLTSSLKLAGCHRLHRNKKIMQAPRTGQSRIKRRIQDRFRFSQLALCMLDRQKLEKAFRPDPRPARKPPLKVKFAHVNRASHCFEARLFEIISL